MRQIFQIIPGGTQFELQNAGFGSCAVSYQGAVVMIGGAFPAHGKVDGWEVNNNILFPISLSDTTLKATTSTLYPTFLRQDIITPAPRSHLQMEEKRFDSNLYHFFIFPKGLLVTGGNNDGSGRLSSTELYLPSKKKWTRGGDLPRHSIKILSTIDIILMMIKSWSPSCWWFLLHIQLRTDVLLQSADLFGRFFSFVSCIL